MFENFLHNAKLNGHEPGYIYKTGTCFCKKCNVPLIYYDGYYLERFTYCNINKLKSKTNTDWITSRCING